MPAEWETSRSEGHELESGNAVRIRYEDDKEGGAGALGGQMRRAPGVRVDIRQGDGYISARKAEGQA